MSGRGVRFEVPYDDGDRARRFYGDVFGWQIHSMPEMCGTTWSPTGPVSDKGMPSEPGYVGGGMTQRGRTSSSRPVITIPGRRRGRHARGGCASSGGSAVGEPIPVGDMGVAAYFQDSEGDLISLSGRTPAEDGASPPSDRIGNRVHARLRRERKNASRRDEIAEKALQRWTDAEGVRQRAVYSRASRARSHSGRTVRTARSRTFFGVCSSATNSTTWTWSPASSSRRARAASVTSATNRSRSVPCRSNGRQHVVVELPEQLVLTAGHGEDDAGSDRALADGGRAASVAVSQAWRLTTRSTWSRSACRNVADLERVHARGIEASCERLAIGHDVGLGVDSEELDLASVAADEEVVEREREVGAVPTRKSTTSNT